MKTLVLRITKVFTIPVLLSFIFLTSSVSAFPINYEFSGTLVYVKSDLSGKFSTGEAFLGSFSFESTTPDADSNPTIGTYFNRFNNFSLEVGSAEFGLRSDSFSFVGVKNNNAYSEDNYLFNLLRMSGPTVNAFYPYLFHIYLESTSAADLIKNDLLPVLLPDVKGFSSRSFFRIYFRDETNNSIPEFIGLSGRLDTMTASSPVPEPSTMLLLGSGLLGLWGARKKFKK